MKSKLMLRAIQHHRLVPAVLTRLIVLSMWGNAMAAVFCPHMMGKSDCCLMQMSPSHSHDRVSESSTSSPHDHMDHMNMSDMDMPDMSMDDMKMHDATASQQTERDLLNDGELEITANTQLPLEVITQPNEPCSHCMMHSRSGASFPVSIAGQSNASSQIAAADAVAATLKSVSSSLTFVELHDLSPPASSAPLYVLVSAFRI
jgi:hypothetical protein